MKLGLITPPGMLFTVAMLAIYVTYASWTAYLDRSWLYGAFAATALVACIGTALLKAWSRYLVYLLTAAFVLEWSRSIYTALQAGYFGFAFRSGLEISLALAPEFALVALSLSCSYLVFRQFHCRRTPTAHAQNSVT